MSVLWLCRGILHAVISCIVEFYHRLGIFWRLFRSANAFRTVFMFFKISHCLLVLMVGILASVFVTSNTNVVFLLKFSFLSACYLPWGRLLTLILNICVLQVIDSKPPVETPFEKLVAELKVKNIHFFTETIMHVVYLPKFCITVVSNFSWVLHSSQRIGKIWGLNRVHCGLCENSEF